MYLLSTKYGPRGGTWYARSRNLISTSAFWNGISISKDVLWLSISFRMGEGNKISFWYDRWCSKIPLKSLYVTLCEFAHEKDEVVAKNSLKRIEPT